MLFRKVCRFLAVPVAVMMTLASSMLGVAQASLVTTDQIIGEMTAAEDRARVQQFFERQDVQQQMVTLGIEPREAAQRVASMSDTEVHEIAGKIDELPAGKNLGVVVGALLIVFLVLLFTDIIGETDVFGFDN